MNLFQIKIKKKGNKVYIHEPLDINENSKTNAAVSIYRYGKRLSMYVSPNDEQSCDCTHHLDIMCVNQRS